MQHGGRPRRGFGALRPAPGNGLRIRLVAEPARDQQLGLSRPAGPCQSNLSITLNSFFKEIAMSKATQPIPPGHEGLIPHLVCSPCTEAIEFYKKAFGAEEIRRAPAPDGRRLIHAEIRIGRSFIFLVDDFPEFCG